MPGDLSPKLERLLEGITDRALAARLKLVHLAAAKATERLSHLNLVMYEPTELVESGADLALWEMMAPAIRDTVVDVNELLDVIGGQFPPVSIGPQDEALVPSGSEDRSEQEISSVLEGCAARLKLEIGEIGEKLRRPEVVADRWTLLTELQRIRAGLRDLIGTMVYLTASACGEIRREDAVPGYEREIQRASLLRATAADLRRAIEGKLARLALMPPSEVSSLALSIIQDFEAFAAMPAYRVLMVPRKKALLELKTALAAAAAREPAFPEEITRLVEPAMGLLDLICAQQTRDTLESHDRAAWTRAGFRLAQAELHMEIGSIGAARVLGEAVTLCEPLYGRDGALDAFLRRARTTPFSGLSGDELREAVARFRERLASLSG